MYFQLLDYSVNGDVLFNYLKFFNPLVNYTKVVE